MCFPVQSIIATIGKYKLSGIQGLKHIDMQWPAHVSGTQSVGLEIVSADFKQGALIMIQPWQPSLAARMHHRLFGNFTPKCL